MGRIHADRIELNNRFKKVFALMQTKGIIVKNHRKLSKSAFAEKLNTKGHIIDKYLQDERKITYAQVKKLCQIYNIREAFMFQGIGSPFSESQPQFASNPAPFFGLGKNGESNSEKVFDSAKSNILFTSIKAFASDTFNMETSEYNEMFHIPGLQGEFVAFNIAGDSMTPSVCDGDMVICTRLPEIDQLEENEIYAVVSENAIRVKRVKRVYDATETLTHLKLISDNFMAYDPVLVLVDDVQQIFKVTKRLTGLEGLNR